MTAWTYAQSTGWLIDPQGNRVAKGYSGHGEGKNNPGAQAIKSVGPIPVGQYSIGSPRDSDHVGPYAMPLTPVGHDALGRSDFLMHGDSRKTPGTASHGCVIMPRNIRELVWQSGNHLLNVVHG